MAATTSASSSRALREVLGVSAFRRLWAALTLSSLGDWLSVLALTSLASAITAGQGYAVQNFAVGGVLILKIMPALLLGPLAGAVADRFDRRRTMIIADLLRFALFVSIPLVKRLDWLLAATFLSECVSLFWNPAKEATVPNLVPRERLESANQLSLFTTYGSAPVAAGLFAVLALISNGLASIVPFFGSNPVDLALYINAVTFLVSAITIVFLREIPKHAPRLDAGAAPAAVMRSIVEGWRFVGGTRMVRGIAVGMLGAFAAGGAVIGVARVYVDELGGGNVAYGAVFAAVFLGLALGMFVGPRTLAALSRRRLFGLAIIGSGIALALVAIVPSLEIVVLLSVFLGGLAGIAWVTGYTLIGLEVEDHVRGRTFSFIQSLAKVDLLLVLAAAPFAAGAIGTHPIEVARGAVVHLDGSNIVMLAGAFLACVVGFVAYYQMDDRRGVPLLRDLAAAVRGESYAPREPRTPGLFVVFEGGEGAGKTTQARALAVWLRDQGFDVVTTHEPGATRVGMRLRAILLDLAHKGLSARAEALMYAADRAEHVDSVILPALERGAIVISDRFVDSSLAYQGAGRRLSVEEVARLNDHATGGLTPDLTVVLDLPAAVGLARFASPADRMESEPREFHERVREGFRELAGREPDRYLVVDATQPVDEIARRVQDRMRPLLPDPVPLETEESTGTMPAVRDPA